MARAGWTIVGLNIRHVGYEIDIVAHKGRTLACIEVKARRRVPACAAEFHSLLPPRKRAALTRGATAMLSKARGPVDTLRIDLAVVYPAAVGALAIAYYVGFD